MKNKKLYILTSFLLLQSSQLKAVETTKTTQISLSDKVENKRLKLNLKSRFEQKFYYPWQQTKVMYKKKEAMWPTYTYPKKKMYAENLQVVPDWFWKKTLENANFENYGSVSKRAISIDRLSLRNFPTNKPIFSNPAKPGEGFPFDYNKNSAVHPNEPVFISHLSKDRKYAYVNTSYAGGFVEVKKLVIATDNLIKKITNYKKLVITKDDVSILNKNKDFLFMSKIGTILPIISEHTNYYKTLTVTSKGFLIPKIEVVNIPKHMAKKQEYTNVDTSYVKTISKTMLEKPYGWGGLLDNRDCSSTLKDLFSTTGVWLPRNSRSQSYSGKQFNLKTMGRTEKEAFIINNGIPYKTLLYMKGHIMLYIGHQNGMVKIFHNMWGVGHIKNGKYTKKITGKTVETNLWIGKNLQKKKFIVDSLRTMTILK